jgi:cation transport regulator
MIRRSGQLRIIVQMPYKNESELPAAVRHHLPIHAQKIYLSAFNNAWEQYANRKKRRGTASREETAHKVAWSAVERVYQKREDGLWRKRQ